MMKKLKLEIMISNYLSNIEECFNNTYEYITNKYSELNRDEIITNLLSIPDTLKKLDEVIEILEQEYENEQLQQTT